MPNNVSGKTVIQQLPIAKGVGSQVQPLGVPGAATAPPQAAVPPPSPLIINGRRVVIDVRGMTANDIVNAINTIPGIVASIDGQGRLTITGVSSIDGDGNLRAILGI